jgi:hypothetical protein
VPGWLAADKLSVDVHPAAQEVHTILGEAERLALPESHPRA